MGKKESTKQKYINSPVTSKLAKAGKLRPKTHHSFKLVVVIINQPYIKTLIIKEKLKRNVCMFLNSK